MNSFAIAMPKTYAEAAGLAVDKRFKLPILKGGGMDVVDHLKEGLIEPDVLVDVRRLREGARDPVSMTEGGPQKLLRIEANATLAELAESKLLMDHAPVIAAAVGRAATPQVRNVATAAGNLLQRPRCWYYRNEQFECLKKGGATCFAVEGENQYHAIFGDGPCHIVHPSNLAPALLVCDGQVHLTGGQRSSLPVGELFHLPDKGVKSEHNLEPGEVITHITCTPRLASGFWAIKTKQSFDWPLVFAVAALDLDGKTIRGAKVCAGAVAPVPWALPKVADALKGLSVDDDAGIAKAAALAAEGAKPMSENGYKVRLLPVAVKRAIMKPRARPWRSKHERPIRTGEADGDLPAPAPQADVC
jgi:xanthine dehydrogenase YagS FAD-binding subunit